MRNFSRTPIAQNYIFLEFFFANNTYSAIHKVLSNTEISLT